MTQTTERKAPSEIDDVEELRREIRIAAINKDNARCEELRVRHKEWREEHTAEIEAAQQKRQERDEQEIAEQAAADRLARYARDNGDWEASLVTQNRFEDNRKTEAKYVNADWARQQAEFERDKIHVQAQKKIEEIRTNDCKAKGLGLTMTQLARELDKDPDTIKYHIGILRKAGEIKSEKYFDKQEADAIRQRVTQRGRKTKKS